MMRKFLLLTLCVCFVMLGVAAHAKDDGTARELFDTLPTMIRAEADAKRQGKLPQGTGQSDPAYLLSFFRNAREYLENGDETSATQQIRQLEYAAVTDPLRDACETIVTRLVKERTNREAAAVAEVSGALQRAGEAVLKSKTPKDLDATLAELAAVSEKRTRIRTVERGNDPYNGTSRLQMAIKFVARWQDYLLAVNRNDVRQITEQLRTLTSETETFQALGIPRSEMIGRVPPTPLLSDASTQPPRRVVSVAEVNAALENAYSRLKVLDDLQPVIHDLSAFRDEMNASSGGYGGNYSDLLNTLSALQALQQAYLELQTGLNRGQFLPALNRYESSGNGRNESRLVGLRAQLIALSLPRLLGAPDTEKPAEGERVDKFLDRLLAEARKRGDWAAVARGVEARRQLAPNSAYDGGGRSEYGGDEGAFRQFFAGQNFEQASQYAQAVSSYLAALASGSQEIPVALISERLAAIKQAHPLEYAGADRTSLPRRMAMPVQIEDMSAPESSTDDTATPVPSPTPTPTPTPTPSPKPTPTASPSPTP